MRRPIRSCVVPAVGRWTLVGTAISLAALLAPVTAQAAGSKSGNGGHSTTGSVATNLQEVSDYSWTNPYSPPWCMTEDDSNQAHYTGALNGTYAVTAQLCGLSSDYYNGMWFDAGGIGIESDVYVVGQLTDLTITAPDGTAHHAVFMGQSTYKGVTTSHYATCFVPFYSISTDTSGGGPLPGGTWTTALSGQVSSASWYVNAQMTDAPFQQSHCPSSEQNLGA
jgi:hypothetical protein